MPYRIAWFRDKPKPYDKAWVRSIRRDGSFRYTSAPRLAKVWLRPNAPQRAIDKRNQMLTSIKPIILKVEVFSDPNEAEPMILVPVSEFEEHGLI